jgi:hypothetical protein
MPTPDQVEAIVGQRTLTRRALRAGEQGLFLPILGIRS